VVRPEGASMKVLAIHDVDDVEHWFGSTKRDEFFEARGMSATGFRGPDGGTTVAVLIETPDMDALQAALATPEAQQAMRHDGVKADTLRILLTT
jgi:hypothetical protein